MPGRRRAQDAASGSEDEGEPSCTAFQGPKPTLESVEPDNCIKILLMTDTHVGYNEKDPIRGMDSINTFREILQLARLHQVDMILHSGDLYHDNVPSSSSRWQVMNAIRETCMGDKPVELECLTDEGVGKRHSNLWSDINYIDGNYNVAIPFFAIHGNHDDPQGTIGSEGPLCALDELNAAGLVNYIGRVDLPGGTNDDASAAESGIKITPVILRKGSTYLSLYGIGNIRDDRFHYELRKGRIQMWKTEELGDDSFNICLVHQNRVPHERNSSVSDQAFGDDVDLVVWGHEHDCINQACAEPVTGRRYYISQPGSSVATSLTKGESISKHVALVKVQGKKFEMEPLRLKTVRPFIWEEISLQQAQRQDGVNLSERRLITRFVKDQVEKLIARANQEWDELHADDEEQVDRELPLIRLRVDYTGQPEGAAPETAFEIPNSQRVGQDFAGRVANPKDLIQFHRKATFKKKSKIEIDMPDVSDIRMDALSQQAERLQISSLVKRYLSEQNLKVLPEKQMLAAVSKFVEKDDRNAVSETIKRYLIAQQAEVAKDFIPHPDGPDYDDLTDKMLQAKQNADAEYDKFSGKKGKGKQKGGSSSDSEDEEMHDARDKKGKAAASKKGKARQAEEDRDSFAEESDEMGGGDDAFSEASSSVSAARASSRGKGKGASTTTTSKKASTSTKSAVPSKRGASKKLFNDEDYDSDSTSTTSAAAPPKKKAATASTKKAAATGSTSTRAKKGKAAPAMSSKQARVQLQVESESD